MTVVRRVLVVEDDDAFAFGLEAFARARGGVVYRAATKAGAIDLLASIEVEVLLLDLALPDGSGAEIVEALASRPTYTHVIVITGSADPVTAFALAQAGVRRFITKPLDLGQLQRVWDQTLAEAPDLRPFVRACVGRHKLHDVEGFVRTQMTDEALAEARGNRRQASRLLGISRQLLQRILRIRD